jgi:hypothetical protein
MNNYGKSGWYDEEKDLALRLFLEHKSYEEIADAVNKWRREKCSLNFIPHRSPRAVIFQMNRIGAISDEELKKWDEENTLKRRKNRQKGSYKNKKKVLIRDNNECVYCGSKENLELVHIIPFRTSKKNEEKESITLCHKHHKIFDGHKLDIKSQVMVAKIKIAITKTIFSKMCSYYPDYSENYKMYNFHCSCHGDSCSIKQKRVEENNEGEILK